MPMLQKVRWDKFCFAVAGGKSEGDSYTSAGYSAKGAAQSAKALLKKPEVKARVAELRAEFASRMTDIKYANKRNRVELLNDLAGRFTQVIVERGANPMVKDLPGGKTGTQCLKITTIDDPTSPNGRRIIPELTTDTATSGEIRALLIQIGREMGDLDPETQTAVTVNVITSSADEAEGDD